jgi:ABC-2 type transport system permease protein
MSLSNATGRGGRIFDLGYQRYTGPRLGRRAAATALFNQSLRTSFGIGRGGRAKIAPFALAGLAILPAILAVGIAALAVQAGAGNVLDEASPVRYETYHGLTVTLLILFCAAQAPELFGRDQRYGVLPLYFSRAITRSDYAVARVSGLITALLIVDLTPQVILFTGRVLVAKDPVAGLGAELPNVPLFTAQAVLTALLLGGLSSFIAAWTPRRAYATAAIIAAAIIPPVVVAIVDSMEAGDIANWLVLLSPGDVLDGANSWLFGAESQNPVIARSDLPGPAYAVAAIAFAVIALGLTIRRYQRISA